MDWITDGISYMCSGIQAWYQSWTHESNTPRRPTPSSRRALYHRRRSQENSSLRKITPTLTRSDHIARTKTNNLLYDDNDDNIVDAFGLENDSDLQETIKTKTKKTTNDTYESVTKYRREEKHISSLNITCSTSFEKMSLHIDALITKGKLALKDNDVQAARNYALQAVVGATEAKDKFLHGLDESITEANLEHWFGECAYILNQIGDNFTATRCFYTATVFPVNWTLLEHRKVSEILWHKLVYSRPQLALLREHTIICGLLGQLEGIAKMAVKRQKWKVGLAITEELQFIHFFMNRCVYPLLIHRGSRTTDPHQPIRTVQKLRAKCALEEGEFLLVKQLCSNILSELSEYDDVEALELWGKALYKTADFEVALRKCELAIKRSENKDEELRLGQLLADIQAKIVVRVDESEPDINWLPEGTLTEKNKAHSKERVVEQRKKKKYRKHSYGKTIDRVQSSPSLSSSLTITLASQKPPLQTSSINHGSSANRNGNNSTIRKLQMEHAEQTRSRHSSMCSNSTSYTESSYISSEIPLSDLDSDDDVTDATCDSCSTRSDRSSPDSEPDDTTNETSFYEQSLRYFSNNCHTDAIENEITDENILKNGLKLSSNYLVPFADKAATVDSGFYETFLKTEALNERLLKRPDIFKRCVIQVESSHLSNCTPINPTDKISMIEISGRSKAGQTFNEDEVVVEVLDKEHENEDKRYGRVLGILNRTRQKDIKHPVFICTLDDMESHLVRPMCKTVPKVHILNTEILKHQRKFKRYKVEIYQYNEVNGTLQNPKVVDVNPGDRQKYVFLVAYITWNRLQIYPRGAIIKMLPCGSSICRGLMILNLQHETPSLYKEKTVKAVESMTIRQGDEPDETCFEERVDLTGLNTFTIDPPGSRDLDDALSIKKNKDGFEVGIHIADVVAYVKKDDPVDEEAKERAVTFYPGIRRPRNMLPEPLSSNHCSLLPNKCRLTLSVLFHLDSKGQLLQTQGRNYTIVRSFIKSRRQFTYQEVQSIIEEPQLNDTFATDIKNLFKLAHARRKDRLGYSMYALDQESEDVTDESLSGTLEAHYLVEEYMILANWKIAQVLVNRFPKTVPLRCQPPPTKESMEQFVRKHNCYIDILVKLQDRQICDFKRPSFYTLLHEQSDKKVMINSGLWEIIASPSSPNATKVIKTDDLHPLQHLVYRHWLAIQERAGYKCSGSLSDKDTHRHYSLAYNQYTHFTSPIRRYNDIVVHRLLHAYLDGKDSPYRKGEIEAICIHVNSKMKRAKDYEKGCKSLQQGIEFKSCPQMTKCFVDEVSDRCVSLCSSAFKHVDKRDKELAFNLLDMSFKPEVVNDTTSGHEIVTATWRKRLYDSKGSSNLPDKGHVQKLKPHPGVVFVPLHRWAKILKCAVNGHLGDLKTAIKDAEVTRQREGSEDVSTECLDPLAILPNTKFSLSFTHGQTVKVQMSAEPRKGMLTPRPVLYNMTTNAKFCLQHAYDPVLYLTRYTTKPTCNQYKTSKQYLERWIPLIHMEAATGAVKNEESFIINNLAIKFTGEKQGKFALPLAFCEVRNIEFSGTVSEDDDDDNDSSGMAYDWLCLKYVISNPQNKDCVRTTHALESVWIGHAEITSVKKRKGSENEQQGRVTVTFTLHDRSPNVPPEVRQSKQSRFSVEVLTKSEVDRRTESFINQLPSAADSLANKIALNVPIPKLDKEHAHIAITLKRDFYIDPSEGSFPLPRNNPRQQEAIDKALKSRFSLIQGPPGTGKTYTGIKLIHLFNKINESLSKEGHPRKQVLFCGPSNKSVDLVAKWMLGKLGQRCPKIVRVYGRSIEAIDFPIPGRTFISKRSTRNLKADDDIRPVALHHLIREKRNKYAEEINAYDKKFKDVDYAPQPALVKKYIHLVREASIEEIRKYDVILCTTAVGSNPKVLKATNVHQVIVDEAGMCPEPQCLVPIIATKAEQVVLIGDHKQLRPIIMCKEAAELGLDISLFERYALSTSAKNVQFTMLNTQYRMNPQLCRFPSTQFYDGKLMTSSGAWCKGRDIDIWPKDRTAAYPHLLVHVEGEEKFLTVSTEEGNEQSKSNTAEVEFAVKVFRYLIEEGVPSDKVNVVSQYNAQCSELRTALDAEGFSNFTVSTVVSSQGGEWDYVIFSTVRSLPDYKIEKNPTFGWCKQNLGFITDKNQINVALTRARKGLIIIGNRNLLQCDNVWKKLVAHYDSRHCIKTPEEFPPPPKTRQQKLMEAQMRNEELYGYDARFIRGEATSFQGDVDDDGWDRNRRRNRRYSNRRPNPQ